MGGTPARCIAKHIMRPQRLRMTRQKKLQAPMSTRKMTAYSILGTLNSSLIQYLLLPHTAHITAQNSRTEQPDNHKTLTHNILAETEKFRGI